MPKKKPLRCVPPDIEALFGVPPLLSTENPRLYREVLDRFAESVAPRNTIEWLWVKDIVDLSWEIARLRRYRALLIERERDNKNAAIEYAREHADASFRSTRRPRRRSRHVETRRGSTLKPTPRAC